MTPGRPRIYLDHNASAPPAAGLVERLAQAWAREWGNPSSAHAEGRRSRALLDAARERIAAATGARPRDVVLTSGGSEADALAVRGLVDAGRVGTIVAWALEHPAVLETARWLEATGRAGLRIVPADRDGLCPPESLDVALRGADRPLVTVMLAQNEIGTLNDLAALAAVARSAGALVHCDAVQALGKIPVEVAALAADTVAVSAHKVGGLPGAGALIVRGGLEPLPFCLGGGQEGRRRQGTESLPAAVAFGLALERIEDRLASAERVRAARDRFESDVLRRVPGTIVAGAGAPRLPNTSALVFENVAGAEVVARCDAEGLAVSAGSACHAGAHGPSPIARALALPASRVGGLVRVSLGPATTDGELGQALDILCRAVFAARLRS